MTKTINRLHDHTYLEDYYKEIANPEHENHFNQTQYADPKNHALCLKQPVYFSTFIVMECVWSALKTLIRDTVFANSAAGTQMVINAMEP